jgi:hypothetical protein
MILLIIHHYLLLSVTYTCPVCLWTGSIETVSWRTKKLWLIWYRAGHLKEPYRAWVRYFVGHISQPLFLSRDSAASLPDGSACWIKMIRMRVLRREASHLFLIPTNLGYGTVVTAACARQGISATESFTCFSWYCEICYAVKVWIYSLPLKHSLKFTIQFWGTSYFGINSISAPDSNYHAFAFAL